ncbi:MAG: hypothetical protein Q8R06_09670 [Polaromonas sp.]|uniref:hypothetical protein n=1 Tax=Polaromonas sp. TaxID=1869339 RepID=UPI002732A3CF|nr:hypothetical protein [Polaromonas sp.]MDP3797403.1 hypothetical protein [Polaromonas sp.]
MATGTEAQITISGKDNTQAAFASVSRSFKALEASAGKLGLALPALSVGAAGGALAALTLEAAKAIDEFNDLKDATGASIENISALDRVARETGGNFDTVAGALVKFNKILNESGDDSKRASEILKALGLDAAKLRNEDPAEGLRQVAVAFSKFADDGKKGQALLELTGKSVREMAPFMKDLADKTTLVASTTTKAAEEAEAFRKEIFKLQANAQDMARAFATLVIPTLTTLLRDFDTFKQKASLSSLAGDVISLNKELKELQSLRGAPYLSADGLEKRIDDATKRLEAAKLRFQNADTATNPGIVLPGTGDFARADRRVLPSLKVPDAKGSGKDPDSDFKAYLSNLEKQIQKTYELNTVEKLLDDIRRGALTVNLKQKSQLQELAEIIDKEKELTEQLKMRREASIAAGDAVNKGNEEYTSLLNRLLDSGPAAQLEKQREAMLLLADALNTGRINAEQFNDAATGFLGLNKQVDQMDDFAKQAAENIQDALGSGLNDILNGEFDNIGNGFKRMLNRMVAEAVAADLSRQLFGSLAKGGSGAGLVGTALSAVGGWLSGGFDMYGGATGAQNSAIMSGVNAGAFGGSSDGVTDALFRKLPKFDVGTDFVPQDMMAVVHKGEKIVPAAQNKPGYGGVTITNHFAISGATDRSSQGQIAVAAGQGVRRALARLG